MNKSSIASLSALLIALTPLGFASPEGEDLLTKPLEGSWNYFSEDPESKLEDVWKVKDGILACKGTPKGGKPAGQWNHYEIVAAGPVVTLKVNGKVVNKATRCDVHPSKICLTAEGSVIEFRNIRLTAASGGKDASK